jgi:hypothetical protein
LSFWPVPISQYPSIFFDFPPLFYLRIMFEDDLQICRDLSFLSNVGLLFSVVQWKCALTWWEAHFSRFTDFQYRMYCLVSGVTESFCRDDKATCFLGRTMFELCNDESRSSNHFCRGKLLIITFYEWV